MLRRHYVYFHYRADTGDIFYVGKGSRTDRKGYARAYESTRRNPLWRSIAKKAAGHTVEIIAEFCDEADALEFERQMIAAHGRRDTGSGTLANLTDGGQGFSGIIQTKETIKRRAQKLLGRPVSAETRQKIADKLSGTKHPRYGKHWPAEIRLKQSLGNMGKQIGGKSTSAKSVADAASGLIFPSVRDAAVYSGMNAHTLRQKLNGYRRNDTAMRYA